MRKYGCKFDEDRDFDSVRQYVYDIACHVLTSDGGLNLEDKEDWSSRYSDAMISERRIRPGLRYPSGTLRYSSGFAEYYLEKSWNESKMVNEADESVYRELVKIDTALGTSVSLQLMSCLCWTTRWDIIKVFF